MDYNEFHKIERSLYNKYKRILVSVHSVVAYCEAHASERKPLTFISKIIQTFALPAMQDIAKCLDHGFTYSIKGGLSEVMNTVELCDYFAQTIAKEDEALTECLSQLQKDCEKLEALITQYRVAVSLLTREEEKEKEKDEEDK